ncbi:response regulator [Paenibacillus sp. TRM 82003]|nr:response regulator [Paenibacillus sp. TRM 82003]
MGKFLKEIGNWECDLTVNGMEAVDKFLQMGKDGRFYDLICLDIMLPRVDGMGVLRIVRDVEKEQGIPPAKVLMTTALHDRARVEEAFALGCQAYSTKPLNLQKIKDVLEKLGLK